MEAIQNLDKSTTILMIAHRISTLKNCDLIIELDQGSIKQICTYQELIP
jgi:ATP-binding cassette subfamily B protein